MQATTIELSEALYQLAEAKAAARGISVTQWLSEAVAEKLSVEQTVVLPAPKPWMRHVGQLSDLHAENQRIMQLIDDEFERLEA